MSDIEPLRCEGEDFKWKGYMREGCRGAWHDTPVHNLQMMVHVYCISSIANRVLIFVVKQTGENTCKHAHAHWSCVCVCPCTWLLYKPVHQTNSISVDQLSKQLRPAAHMHVYAYCLFTHTPYLDTSTGSANKHYVYQYHSQLSKQSDTGCLKVDSSDSPNQLSRGPRWSTHLVVWRNAQEKHLWHFEREKFTWIQLFWPFWAMNADVRVWKPPQPNMAHN